MKQILFLLLTFSLFFACNKDDEPTPENWTEDDNIFRCKVNGVDWEPEGDNLGFSGGNLDIYYENFFNDAIQFRASKNNNEINEFLSISIFVEQGVIGTYEILNNKLFIDFTCGGNYFRDSIAENTVIISEIDSVNNIIEGEFYFTANTTDCSITKLDITEGYFKAKYRN